MIRRLAIRICALAGHALPLSRTPWRAAMMAEVASIDADRDAARFALGCLIAGLRVRLADVDTRFAAGIWSLALVGALGAVAHLGLAWRGARLLASGPDRFFSLLQAANPDHLISRAVFDTAMPIVACCFLMLGLAHACGGWLLLRGQLGRFAIAWSVGLMFAIIAVAVQLSVVWSLDGLPSEFTALLVQMLGLPALLFWSRARQDDIKA